MKMKNLEQQKTQLINFCETMMEMQKETANKFINETHNVESMANELMGFDWDEYELPNNFILDGFMLYVPSNGGHYTRTDIDNAELNADLDAVKHVEGDDDEYIRQDIELTFKNAEENNIDEIFKFISKK